MPIVNICDGCGKRLQVLGKNTLIGKRLTYGIFCDACFKDIEDFAIRKYKIKVEAKNETWKQ